MFCLHVYKVLIINSCPYFHEMHVLHVFRDLIQFSGFSLSSKLPKILHISVQEQA